MDEEQANFKVTDRRLFNADGSPRDPLPVQESDSQAQAESSEPPTGATASGDEREVEATASPAPDNEFEPAEEEFADAEIPDAHDPAGFINFAMSIASNAAAALGMVEHPVTHKREVDLELGKHWIDVLGMLQKKTKGNLTEPEANILEDWLAQLRMQYVSLGASAPKGPQAFTGRDIIGGK
jgi:Domain of unknown function (DUF1844)